MLITLILTHQEEKVDCMREYLNLTTLTNHYHSLIKYNHFVTFYNNTINLGIFVDPKEFYIIWLQHFIQNVLIVILLISLGILWGNNNPCDPFWLNYLFTFLCTPNSNKSTLSIIRGLMCRVMPKGCGLFLIMGLWPLFKGLDFGNTLAQGCCIE
jgi:hypothetical protein